MSQNLITRFMINEYKNKEASNGWLLGFCAHIADVEPEFYSWYAESVHEDCAMFGQRMLEEIERYGPAAALAKCTLILASLSRSYLMRGFYMGMRKYTSELDFVLGSYPGKRAAKRSKKPTESEDSSEFLENEIELTDDDFVE